MWGRGPKTVTKFEGAVLVVFEETEELQIHYINFIVANSKD